MAENMIKILAIDDNTDNLVTIQALIREAVPHAQVITAADGPSGLAAAERENPDVILLDILMPGMDGYTVCRQLKNHPLLSDTPVVFITALKDDRDSRIQALESGAEGFLSKPLDISELTVLIRAMVKIRQANVEKRNEKARLSRLVAEQTQELRQSYVKTIELLEDLRQESQVRRESEERALALVAELQEADNNKTRFISILSHELRNPLAAIALSLSLIEQTDFDPVRSRRAWEIISRQTQQLTRMVDDLLDVTRINENKITLKMEPVELTGLVRRTLDDLQASFQQKGVTLHGEQPEQPIHLVADPVRLTQVLENLLHNSLKFTHTGDEVKVQVCLRRNRSTVQIRVRDTGTGIEAELLNRLFEPFTQADRSLARSQGGLGLGLAIARGIVERHKGRIEVNSAGKGKGTEFIITLPVPRAGQPEDGGVPGPRA